LPHRVVRRKGGEKKCASNSAFFEGGGWTIGGEDGLSTFLLLKRSIMQGERGRKTWRGENLQGGGRKKGINALLRFCQEKEGREKENCVTLARRRKKKEVSGGKKRGLFSIPTF